MFTASAGAPINLAGNHKLDPVLLPFIQAPNEMRAQAHLEWLILQFADPVITKTIQRITRYVAKSSGTNLEGIATASPLRDSDLHSEAVRVLLQRICAIRHSSATPIANLVDYIRITVYHLFVQHFRDTRLEQTGIAELASESSDGDLSALVEQRSFLYALWGEIRELPKSQCVALLCNIRDKNGSTALPLLELYKIAPRSELADALNMPEKDLESFFSQLPMDDREIAVVLDLTPKGVANQRSIARRRLERRIRAWLV